MFIFDRIMNININKNHLLVRNPWYASNWSKRLEISCGTWLIWLLFFNDDLRDVYNTADWFDDSPAFAWREQFSKIFIVYQKRGKHIYFGLFYILCSMGRSLCQESWSLCRKDNDFILWDKQYYLKYCRYIFSDF